MEKELTCSSCNVKISNLVGAVKFKCPKCSEQEIARCPHCRKISAKYKCPACSFTGP